MSPENLPLLRAIVGLFTHQNRGSFPFRREEWRLPCVPERSMAVRCFTCDMVLHYIPCRYLRTDEGMKYTDAGSGLVRLSSCTKISCITKISCPYCARVWRSTTVPEDGEVMPVLTLFGIAYLLAVPDRVHLQIHSWFVLRCDCINNRKTLHYGIVPFIHYDTSRLLY